MLCCAVLCYAPHRVKSSGSGGSGDHTVALLVDASSHVQEKHSQSRLHPVIGGNAYLIGPGTDSTQVPAGSIRNAAAADAVTVTRGVGSPPSLRVRHSSG